jgi:hypothetical protein
MVAWAADPSLVAEQKRDRWGTRRLTVDGDCSLGAHPGGVGVIQANARQHPVETLVHRVPDFLVRSEGRELVLQAEQVDLLPGRRVEVGDHRQVRLGRDLVQKPLAGPAEHDECRRCGTREKHRDHPARDPGPPPPLSSGRGLRGPSGGLERHRRDRRRLWAVGAWRDHRGLLRESSRTRRSVHIGQLRGWVELWRLTGPGPACEGSPGPAGLQAESRLCRVLWEPPSSRSDP